MRLGNKFAKLYREQCPCCGVAMLDGSSSSLAPEEQGRRRTRADIFPKGHPSRRTRDWLYACHRCNNDQGSLALDEWWLVLVRRGDERHHNLRAMLQQLGGRDGLCAGSVRSFVARIDESAPAASL